MPAKPSKRLEFKILSKSDAPQQSARLGSLSVFSKESSKSLQTPSFLMYTSMGSVPHLSQDLVFPVNDIENDEITNETNWQRPGSVKGMLVALEAFIPLTTTGNQVKADHRRSTSHVFDPTKFTQTFPSVHSYLGYPFDKSLIVGDLRDTYGWLHLEPNQPVTDKFVTSSTLSG